MDDLCVLPHVGPETQGILRNKGYESYEKIAQATPFELYQECDIGLSNTSAIINAAMAELECPCPKCGGEDVNPIWGGYPGDLSDEQEENNDIFCGSCLWLGDLTDLTDERTVTA